MNGVFARVARDWEGFQLQVQEMYEAGDAVIVTGRYKGVFKPNGRNLDAQFAYVMKLRDKKTSVVPAVHRYGQWRDGRNGDGRMRGCAGHLGISA